MEFLKPGMISFSSFQVPQAVTAYARASREAATAIIEPAFALRDRAADLAMGLAERVLTAPAVFHDAASGVLARAVQIKDGGLIPSRFVADPWQQAQQLALLPFDSSVWQMAPYVAEGVLIAGVAAAAFAVTVRPAQIIRERGKIQELISQFMKLKTRIEEKNEEIEAVQQNGGSISDAESGDRSLIEERQDLLTKLHATWQELYDKQAVYHERFSGSVLVRAESASLLRQIAVITGIHDRLVGTRVLPMEGGAAPQSRLDRLEDAGKRPKGPSALPQGWGVYPGGRSKSVR